MYLPLGALNAACGCLFYAAVVAVITNALLVSFSSTAMAADLDLFTNIGSRYKQSDLWLTVLVMEHALLVCDDLRLAIRMFVICALWMTLGRPPQLLKFLVATFVPDVNISTIVRIFWVACMAVYYQLDPLCCAQRDSRLQCLPTE